MKLHEIFDDFLDYQRPHEREITYKLQQQQLQQQQQCRSGGCVVFDVSIVKAEQMQRQRSPSPKSNV